MRVAEHYSHLNGLEFLLVHQPDLWREIKDVVESADADRFKVKVSREKTMMGKKLYSPIEINRAVGKSFMEKGWTESRTYYWVTKRR